MKWIRSLITDDSARAFSEGQFAAQNGATKANNPYDFETQTGHWLHWNRGVSSHAEQAAAPATKRSSNVWGFAAVFFLLFVINALWVGPVASAGVTLLLALLSYIDHNYLNDHKR
ncbi:hypothetical protein [Burkholderia vietnamiensis]|uniref:hypothetical protein n=1 Tax=Burkholderia vietnamiensis TaxID=60552 RepID=UPI00158D4326|nr:hypothetical protein [Burkholderia vietnamiensis]